MKRTSVKLGLLLGFLTLGAAPAQQEGRVYIGGGIFLPSEDAKVYVSGATGTVIQVKQVTNPDVALAGLKNPEQEALPKGTLTRLVRTVKTDGERQLSLGKLPSGVYVLESGKSRGMVLVTTLGLVVKRDAGSGLTYTADVRSGAVRGAKVWLVGQGGPKTSAGGLASFKLPKEEAGRPREQLFLARSGNDWAVSGAWWRSYEGQAKVRGYVYSDRTVYRPGQHVDFKGVLRERQSLKPLAGKEFTVTVFAPDSEQVFRQTLKTNEFGSLSAGFDLSEAARVGAYRFELRGADNERLNIYSNFMVEAYQKPEYEVNVLPVAEKAVQGEKTRVKVVAKYLFGGTVSGGRVKYRVVREPTSGDWWENREYVGQKLIIQEDTRLNANGELDILLPLERDKNGQRVGYRIEAEVEDEARRPFSAQASLTAYPSALTVDTRLNSSVYDAGKPIEVTLKTQDLKDRGQSTTVLLELVRQNWEYRNGKYTRDEDILQTRTVKTDAQGHLKASLSTPKGGGYVVRATVKDAAGRKAKSEGFLWVFKPGERWNWYSRELSVKFDKETYQVGDTANVLVMNPNPGTPVLLTLEGEKLRGQQVLDSQGAVLRYQFKVTEDLTPNVIVAATSLKDGRLLQGEQSVKVTRPDAKLKVTVQPAKTKYAPGDQGQFKVSVKDASGKGVRAEMAFNVVDQAILLLRPDQRPALLEVFEEPIYNVVGTSHSLYGGYGYYGLRRGGMVAQSAVAPASPTMAPAPALTTVVGDATANASAGSAADAPVKVRTDFRDTLLWIPSLVTDAQGNATVNVTFPDNTTTWVSQARAQTVLPRFGEGQASVMTTKDVVARLSLPPFLVRGDQVTLSGIVNNTLNKAITGKANMELDGLKGVGGNVLGGTPLSIPALGRARFDASATARTLGQSRVTFTARSTLGNDALRLPIPVKARGYDMSVTSAGSANTTMNLTLPADTAADSTRLRVDLTPSLLSAVAPALEYLIGYPYGCTEQTMSRFLPALLARQSLGENGLPASVRKELDKYTALGLARLEKFQHRDGGWNFWENDESTVEMTAYVVEGLLRAKATGAKVNNRMLDRGLTYLVNHVDDKGVTQAERARTYRVLAMTDRAPLNDLLAFAKHTDLQPYALAQVALALNHADQKAAAQTALERLKTLRKSTQNGSLVYWEKKRDDSGWNWYWDDNEIQVTASALEALTTLEPQSSLIPRVSQWLLMQKRGERWLSTQDTTSVIIAALKLPKAPAGAFNVQVLLDGKTVGTVRVQGHQASTFTLKTPLQSGQHTVNLKGAPAGLIAASKVDFSREPAALNGINDRGMTLYRQYERLIPTWDKSSKRYIYTKTPVLNGKEYQPLQVGDLVLVTLTIEAKKPARYLLVSDPIPAGMKALDDRSLAYVGETPRNNPWDWWYWYSGRDLLDDRVDLYAYWMEGQQKMTYLLRAQTPGTFTALPTHAFLMYDPDVEGYGPAATFTVKDRGE